MKIFISVVALTGILLFMTTPVMAEPLNIQWDYMTGQDNNLRPETDELGDKPPFPDDEWIISSWQETTYRPCYENEDSPSIPNIEVSITNMTGRSWWNLQYVADVSYTVIQNYDEWRINEGLAFLIDYAGANTPLRSESMIADLIFQPNETWVFVIQDFQSIAPATPFGSIGVGNQSMEAGPLLSTGSIIAYVPEPGTLALMVIGCLPLLRRKW